MVIPENSFISNKLGGGSFIMRFLPQIFVLELIMRVNSASCYVETPLGAKNATTKVSQIFMSSGLTSKLPHKSF